MIKRLFFIALTGTSVLMILALIVSGCARNYTVNSRLPQNNEPHWFVDESGHFHTDNVSLAQKEIPFSIIVPDYLPDLLGNDYLFEIIGPFKNPLPEYTEVQIQIISEYYQILISEYDKKIVALPNNELEPMYYNITGIQVLRQVAKIIYSNHEVNGFSFVWNPDGLTFDTRIFNIPEEEGIKIVESMIKQME